MRQVTENAVNAFKADGNFCGSNTNVVTYRSTTEMLLHMHVIAHKHKGEVSISLSGWNTVTTRERLNGLLRVYNRPYGISSRQGQAHLVWFDDKKQHKKPIDDSEFYTLAELDAMTGLYDAIPNPKTENDHAINAQLGA